MNQLAFILAIMVLLSCTQSRVIRFERLIEPRIGKAKKLEMDKKLGQPTKCNKMVDYLRCEYRTAREKNNPIPDVFRPVPGMGPDLSPYEHFDVIHLFYDDFSTLQDWAPIVVKE